MLMSGPMGPPPEVTVTLCGPHRLLPSPSEPSVTLAKESTIPQDVNVPGLVSTSMTTSVDAPGSSSSMYS